MLSKYKEYPKYKATNKQIAYYNLHIAKELVQQKKWEDAFIYFNHVLLYNSSSIYVLGGLVKCSQGKNFSVKFNVIYYKFRNEK